MVEVVVDNDIRVSERLLRRSLVRRLQRLRRDILRMVVSAGIVIAEAAGVVVEVAVGAVAVVVVATHENAPRHHITREKAQMTISD